MLAFDSAPSPARAAVDRLPRDLQTVLLLRIVSGLSVSRCAQLLGVTDEEVRMQQHRALGQLRAGID